MENEKSLQRLETFRTPAFIERAYDTLEAMKDFASMLAESQMLPNHFYGTKMIKVDGREKKEVDFSAPKIASIVLVLTQGYQLSLPPLVAVQHIIPINGLLSIKGDMAKSLIFSSGLLLKGSWKEEISGDIAQKNYKVTISATRIDNNASLSRSFSIEEAILSGLWITETMAKDQTNGWKHRLSPWYRFGPRMIYYRALGFLSRDLFGDVLNGIYTYEEARDIQTDVTEIIEGENGTLIIPQGRPELNNRSEKLTETVSRKIAKEQGQLMSREQLADKIESQYPEGRNMAELAVNENSNPGSSDKFDNPLLNLTLQEMMAMKTEDLQEKAMEIEPVAKALLTLPGKNTNKKIRDILIAFREERLEKFVEATLAVASGSPSVKKQEGNTEENTSGAAGGMQPNTGFFEETQKDSRSANKYQIEIPPLDKGESRDFRGMKQLYDELSHVSPSIGNERFLELRNKIPAFGKFTGKEDFCGKATIDEVCLLLNEN